MSSPSPFERAPGDAKGGVFVIDIGSYDEMVFWAGMLGIEVRTLIGAVKAVGTSLDSITQYLEDNPGL